MGLPALPLSGVDAVVAFDSSQNQYRIYFVSTGLSSTIYSDGSAAINDAFGTAGVNIVGLYQEVSCTGQVSIPNQGGLRGLGQTYGSPVMPGLKAVSPFPTNTELVLFPAANSLCDVRDLTFDASNIALSAAKIGGNMGFWSGVSFMGGTGDSLVVTGANQTFMGCIAGAGGQRAASFNCGDMIWIGGWLRNPGDGYPAAEWLSGSDGHIVVGVHSVATGGAQNLKIAGTKLIFGNLYVDGAKSTAYIDLLDGSNCSFTGGHIRQNNSLGGAMPIFRTTGSVVLVVSGMRSFQGGNQGFAKVMAVVSDTPHVIFSGCDFADLASSSLSGDFDQIPVLAAVNLNNVPVGGLFPQSADVQATASTTSTTYTDLTGGPSVTVQVGPSGTVLVLVSAEISNSTSGKAALASIKIDSGTPSDANAAKGQSTSLTTETRMTLLTGLSQGQHTLVLQYRVVAGTGNFGARRITALPL